MYLFQIFALLALTVASGFGADATFPKDGQRVYLIQSDAPKQQSGMGFFAQKSRNDGKMGNTG